MRRSWSEDDEHVIVIVVRQTRQVPSSASTLFAKLSQKRACPHGTHANPSRDATRQTSQLSSFMRCAASVTAVVVAVEADAGVAVVSCVASSLLLSLYSARRRFDALLPPPRRIM